MKFLLFDREEKYIGNLKDVLEAKQTEEINGEDVLELAVLEQKVENFSDEWGRNLLRNSDFSINDTSGWNAIYGTHKIEDGIYIKTLTDNISAARAEFYTQELKPGMYTFSMRAKSEKGFRYDRFDGTEYVRKNIDGSTEFRKSHITFEVIEPQRVFIRMYYTDPEVGDVMEIDWVKLEKGSTATPWTPAPEDVDIQPHYSIEKGYKIVYKDKQGHWKEYIVKEIEESHTSDGIEKRLFCESSFYETFGDYIEDKRPSGTASHALSVALEPTRWEVGIVDNLGTDTTSFYQISAKEAIQKVAETWKGEIRTRVEVVGNKIVHRYVDILARRGGDYGKRFTYSKNLESVTKTIHREDVITALYGYGKGEEVGDGHGRRIDFASINDGKAYVENNEAREIWGRPNGDGTKSHVFDKVYFDNCEDKQELLQLTTEKLEEVSSPLITYEAKAIDLGGADLGDSVAVIDTEFTPELRLKARVIKIVRDLLEEENNGLTLGNFVPSIVDSWNKQEEFINNFRSKAGVWDRAKIIDSDGTINAQFINNIVDELNRKMNAQGGYVYVSDDGKGLITYDKPIDQDPTMAIQLLGGAFRIANNKLPNGEWDWRTFGTGAGFTADEFVAGVLRGGKVHFDLTNGTFLIGDSPEDYILYFDGTTLKVRLGTGKTIEDSLQDIQDHADTKASQAESAAKAYAELKAQEEVDSLEIGGRNLLKNSDFSNGLTGWATSPSAIVSIVDDNDFYKVCKVEASGRNQGIYRPHTTGDLTAGETYTLVAMVKADDEMSIGVAIDGSGLSNGMTKTIGTSWEKVVFTKVSSGSNTQSRIYSNSVGTFYIAWVKTEKGNKASDWTPAPEDVDASIDNAKNISIEHTNEQVSEINATIGSITQRVESTESDITTINGIVAAHNTRLESAESKITPNAIVDTVRSSTAYTNDLDGKISKNNIISEINQSAEEVQINANRVKIGMGTTFEQGQIYTWEQYAGKTWLQMIS